MTSLSRRFYLCPPDYFQITYSINHWMDLANQVHPARARDQWETLRATYARLGAEVCVLDPEPNVPELTFPGDSIFLYGNQAISSHFRYPERQPEIAPMAHHFSRLGYILHTLPEKLCFEGNAEAILWNGQLMAGYGMRSDLGVYPFLSRLLDVEVHPFEMREPYFHFDVAFAPVDDTLALCVPSAYTSAGLDQLRRLVSRLIYIDDAEAALLACNSITVNDTVILSTPHAPCLTEQLRQHGKEVVTLDLSEFRKAGGGVKCLTLEAYGYQSPMSNL